MIRLKFQNGFSYCEISRISGHSVTHVGYLIHTGLKTLRGQLYDGPPAGAPLRGARAHDPTDFAQLEVEIYDHFRRLADQVTASLLARATTTHDQAEPGKKGVPTPPAAADAPPTRARGNSACSAAWSSGSPRPPALPRQAPRNDGARRGRATLPNWRPWASAR